MSVIRHQILDERNILPMRGFINIECITLQNSLMNKKGYHIINVALGSVILCIILYSLLFRGNNHPMPALLTQITGMIPPSKGLSASFSELVRGNFEAAALLNPYGLRIFAFFIVQLLTRVLVSLAIEGEWTTFSRIVMIDSLYSIALFGICFAPLIGYTIQLFANLF